SGPPRTPVRALDCECARGTDQRTPSAADPCRPAASARYLARRAAYPEAARWSALRRTYDARAMPVEEIREQRYRDERPNLDFSDLHARTRNQDAGATQTAVRVISWPIFKAIWRMHHEGRENVPRRGPVIIAANHASFLDHFLIGHGIPRPLNYMAKSQL